MKSTKGFYLRKILLVDPGPHRKKREERGEREEREGRERGERGGTVPRSGLPTFAKNGAKGDTHVQVMQHIEGNDK